ncbi:hypothetical protein SCUP234_04688 [Seiridium cupressi]
MGNKNNNSRIAIPLWSVRCFAQCGADQPGVLVGIPFPYPLPQTLPPLPLPDRGLAPGQARHLNPCRRAASNQQPAARGTRAAVLLPAAAPK